LTGHLKAVQSLLLADDGKTLVSTSNDHKVRLWNLDERTELESYDSASDVGPVVFDRKRGLLIIGNSAGELQSIDTHEKRKIALAKQIDKIEALALHPNEPCWRLATGADKFACGASAPQEILSKTRIKPGTRIRNSLFPGMVT